MVAVAVQFCQCRIAAQIQALQLIVAAVQHCQRSIAAHIQALQLIGGAVQNIQFSILAHIQALQLIEVAIQCCQRCEILHTGQVGNSQVGDINGCHRCNFLCGQNTVTIGVAIAVHIVTEDSIGEVRFINGNVPHIRYCNSTGDCKTVGVKITDLCLPCKGSFSTGSCVKCIPFQFPCNRELRRTVLCLNFNIARQQCNDCIRIRAIHCQDHILRRRQTCNSGFCCFVIGLLQRQSSVFIQSDCKVLCCCIFVEMVVAVGGYDDLRCVCCVEPEYRFLAVPADCGSVILTACSFLGCCSRCRGCHIHCQRIDQLLVNRYFNAYLFAVCVVDAVTLCIIPHGIGARIGSCRNVGRVDALFGKAVHHRTVLGLTGCHKCLLLAVVCKYIGCGGSDYRGNRHGDAPVSCCLACEVAHARDGQCVPAGICSGVAGDGIIIRCQRQIAHRDAFNFLGLGLAVVNECGFHKRDFSVGNAEGVNCEFHSHCIAGQEIAHRRNLSCCSSYIFIILIANGVVLALCQRHFAAEYCDFRLDCRTRIGLRCNLCNHVLCQNSGNRNKCKGCCIAVSKVIGIGNRLCRIGNFQSIAINFRICPVGNLSKINPFRQCTQVKCIARHADFVLVIGSIQVRQCCVIAHIQARQLIVAAVQFCQ